MDLGCWFTLHTLYTLWPCASDYACAVQQQLFKRLLTYVAILSSTSSSKRLQPQGKVNGHSKLGMAVQNACLFGNFGQSNSLVILYTEKAFHQICCKHVIAKCYSQHGLCPSSNSYQTFLLATALLVAGLTLTLWITVSARTQALFEDCLYNVMASLWLVPIKAHDTYWPCCFSWVSNDSQYEDKKYYSAHNFATRVSYGTYVSVYDGFHGSVVRIL